MLAFSLIFASAAALVAPADPAVVFSAASSATSSRFPDADSVTIEDRIHTRYEPDGSDVTWDDEWIKILTEKGRRAHASVSLSYNARYGDATIHTIEIVGTNGAVRAVDFAKTLKIATDNSSMSANIVDPMDKKISCAVPGLAVGEIRHVVFSRRTRKARMKNAWADVTLLEYTAPILSTVVTVDQPPSLPVAKAVLRHPFKDTVVQSPPVKLPDGYTRLAWTARDVPQAFPEPDMPPLSRCVQALRLSTVPDWQTVSRWYWSLCAPHLSKTTPAMTNLVRSLVKDCPDATSKTRAVFKFVSQEIRYMGLTLEDDAPGYEPHDVDITFDNRYGVCRDKAALLVALLRIAGLPAYPVLIHAGAKMDAEVPIPYFNHAVVAVAEKGGYTLMDPTDESTRDLFPAYLSNKSYLVARPDGDILRTSPVPSVEENRLSVSATASLSPDGDILYSAALRFGGLNDNAFRHSFLKKKPLERRRQFEGFLRRMASGAELLALDIEPSDLRNTERPLSAHLTAKLPSRVLNGVMRDELSIPLLTRSLNLADMILDGSTSLETRRFPLALASTCGADETLTLSLGDSLGPIRALPPDVAVTNVPGYSFVRSMRLAGGRLAVRRRLDLSAVEFDVKAYDDLRNARKEVETAERAKAVFAKSENDEANVRTILDRTVKHFKSPKSWVSTNIVEKEVLTYRGKQLSAELKFSYAPCTRAMELVSATVSNKNGKVFAVSPREINEMDCSWAASAPRYPASKQMVVNLPGVEIGSVVKYVLRVDVTNSPVAFTQLSALDGTQPIDCIDIELHVPKDMPFVFAETFGDATAPSNSQFSTLNSQFHWTAVRPPRIPDEPSQPAAELWRRTVRISAADFKSYARELSDALAAARAAGSSSARRIAADCAIAASTPAEKISAVRTYLAHHVRVTGPGLFELPFDRAFSPPDRALSDGYASSADYMNLFFTMLEALGFDCSFVLADNVPRGDPLRVEMRRAVPFPEWFDSLVIRAEMREGGFPGIFGFLAFGGERHVFHLGRENEYTPPEASSHVDEPFLSIPDASFGVIPAHESNFKFQISDFKSSTSDFKSSTSNSQSSTPDSQFSTPNSPTPNSQSSNLNPQISNSQFSILNSLWSSFADNRCLMTVRDNGSVDFDVTNYLYGAGVGGFRKRFTEMLPEMRSRFYQQLVGELSQNATATKELVTDVESYPAETSFSAYVEGFAVVQKGTMSVTIPDFSSAPFGVSGSSRKTPFSIGGKSPEMDSYEVVFPKGWTEIEHLPESFLFTDPSGRCDVWLLYHEATSRIDSDGLLHVTVRRLVRRDRSLVFPADYFPMFREWNRRAASPAARTIIVRRAKGGR